MTTTQTAARAQTDFADVYRDHVTAVWRYVRSRIPDHHAAQDVTSDVFTRALKSWSTFDPRRGSVPAWLFGVAPRAVADWWRHRVGDVPTENVGEAHAMDYDGAGETMVLREEFLRDLGRGLQGLHEREREALALRFAAGLKMAQIGAILGTSEGATRMLVSRAVASLRQCLTGANAPVSHEGEVADLEGIIDGVLSRGHSQLGDDGLRELVLHLAVLHQPTVPEDLPDRIAACVACGDGSHPDASSRGSNGSGDASPARIGIASRAGLGWTLIGPACLACVLPGLWPTLTALGLLGAAAAMHDIALILIPALVWLLWRQYRRHGHRSVAVAGTVGGIMLMGHWALHVRPDVWLTSALDWVGTILLIGALILNVVFTRRWVAAQRAGFHAALTS